MFKPSLSIDYNFSPDSLRLLPEGPIELPMKLKFSQDGVLDFEDLLGQLLVGLEANMGKLKSISQAGRDNLKNQLANAVIKRSINIVDDVLAAFTNDGEQYWDDELRLHMPLSMRGSNYKLDYIVKFLPDGSPDFGHMVESLESAYKDVLKGAIS